MNTKMFALKKSDHIVRDTVPAETVADIAAAVGKGPQLHLAESNINALRARRDALRAEEMALSADHRAGRGSVTPAAVNAVSLQIKEIEKEINTKRPGVSALRRARADRVNDALLSTQQEAAARILAAYAEITSATDTLIACNEEIRRAGNPDRPHLNHVAGVALLDYARGLLK